LFFSFSEVQIIIKWFISINNVLYETYLMDQLQFYPKQELFFNSWSLADNTLYVLLCTFTVVRFSCRTFTCYEVFLLCVVDTFTAVKYLSTSSMSGHKDPTWGHTRSDWNTCCCCCCCCCCCLESENVKMWKMLHSLYSLQFSRLSERKSNSDNDSRRNSWALTSRVFL